MCILICKELTLTILTGNMSLIISIFNNILEDKHSQTTLVAVNYHKLFGWTFITKENVKCA